MQPHRAMIWPGLRRLPWTRAPTLPNTRCSACSRMAQVLMTMIRASSSLPVKPKPIFSK